MWTSSTSKQFCCQSHLPVIQAVNTASRKAPCHTQLDLLLWSSHVTLFITVGFDSCSSSTSGVNAAEQMMWQPRWHTGAKETLTYMMSATLLQQWDSSISLFSRNRADWVTGTLSHLACQSSLHYWMAGKVAGLADWIMIKHCLASVFSACQRPLAS